MYLLAALQYGDPTIVRKPAAPVPRPRKACLTCRTLKTKCLPGESGPTGRCSRCTRLKLECEYIHQPRGPRKGSSRCGAARTVSQSPHFRTPTSPAMPLKSPVEGHPQPQPQPQPHPQGPPTERRSLETEDQTAPPRKRPREWNQDMAPPTPSTTSESPYIGRQSMPPPDADTSLSIDQSDTPGNDSSTTTTHRDSAPQALNFLATEMRTTLEEYLDSRDNGRNRRLPSMPMADVVSAGLITECDACFLFRRFEQQVSPSSHLFDPGYHTFDQVRKSVPLFNAVMYASARFFAPKVADAIYEMASTMINRALQDGFVDVTLVQALLVLVYWKKPQDPTAYHKLGLATRLMCQLRVEWDLNPDPSAAHEDESAKVDAERTAYNAFSMDASYAMMLRLPVMPWSLPKSADLMRWAVGHSHLNVPGDYFKVFVTECWELQRNIGSVSPDNGVGVEGSGIVRRISAMTERWDNHPCLTGVLRYLAKLLGKTFLLKAHIVAARSRNNCVSIACLLDDISDIIRHLKVSGEAVFLNDLSASMLSTPAVIVYNGRNDFDPDTMACAAAFVRDMSELFRTLPPYTPEDHALQSVQRCYLRVEGALDQSTAGGLSEAAHDNIVGQLHQLLADNWPALAFSPEEAMSTSVLDPSWLASMQFI